MPANKITAPESNLILVRLSAKFLLGLLPEKKQDSDVIIKPALIII